MAFAVFADAPVDVAVVEVGMGGTWDATNVADGPVAVVTPIAMDHTELPRRHDRGDRRGEGRDHQAGRGGRARPAAGRGAAEVLLRRARRVGATVAREGIEFGVLQPRVARRRPAADRCTASRRLRRPVPAAVRRAPGAATRPCALAAVEAFARRRRGDQATLRPLDEDLVRDGVRRRMSSPGRMEVVRRSPTVMRGRRAQPGRAWRPAWPR